MDSCEVAGLQQLTKFLKWMVSLETFQVKSQSNTLGKFLVEGILTKRLQCQSLTFIWDCHQTFLLHFGSDNSGSLLLIQRLVRWTPAQIYEMQGNILLDTRSHGQLLRSSSSSCRGHHFLAEVFFAFPVLFFGHCWWYVGNLVTFQKS